MRRRNKAFAIVAALVAAQVFSGCYVLRELDWSKDKVDKGKTTTARIGLQGTNDFADGRFFLLTFLETDSFDVKGAKFDTKKALGGTKKMVRDDELLNLAFGSENCQAFLPIARAGGVGITALYRTNGDVPESRKLVDAQLKLKAAGGNQGGSAQGFVLSGVWIDDGDGQPEDPDASDDEVSCSGATTTTVTKKGPLPPVRSGFDLSDLAG